MISLLTFVYFRIVGVAQARVQVLREMANEKEDAKGRMLLQEMQDEDDRYVSTRI